MKGDIEQRTIDGIRRSPIRSRASVILALGLAAGMMSPTLAETTKPSTGVHGVTGRVTYSGPPEKQPAWLKELKDNPKYRDLIPRSSFCRKVAPSELVDGNFPMLKAIEVGAKGELKGAIVAVTDILDDKFMADYPGTDVVIERCRYSPFTGVVVKGKSLRVENLDADPNDPKAVKGVSHNAHAFEVQGVVSKTIFNVFLPEKGSRFDKPVGLNKEKKGSEVRLQSDDHPWEQAFFLFVTNPYYAKATDDGTFVIKGVPPGRHRIVAWHPFAGRAEADIVVDERGSAQVNFELQKRKGESRPSD
ncbi:MAG TPA: carboxypeptidase-like regulatory domain-containing protein [Nitrospiraceae bacterium]|nr:carboxypeptidase-like regulatory domain-containing protein [Nitrospiraceae bacterium]